MRFATRAAPLVLIVGVALLGCGKDGGGKGADPVKKFEGAMPTAGAADVTIHLRLA
jgi:hypothetical protein